MAKSVEERVKDVVAEVLKDKGVDASKIENSDKIIDDLGADSLDTTEITVALEKEFNIDISDEEAVNLTTVKKMIDFVKKKMAEK